MDFDWDCIVVGAGPAGLSAALTLGRARRRVLVLDSGAPRNFAAHAMHGVLGHDGLDPAALRARGTEELGRYGIEVRAADVDPARARAFDGGVELEGQTARTLILATGLLDETPAIDGFDAIYGVSAHTCPYCDGWEHRDERIAVFAPVFGGAHLGRMLRQWSGDVVVLTGGGPGVDADEEAELAEIGVPVVREPIERFAARDGRLTAIELTGRPPLERDALFFHVAMRPRTALAAALGCTLGEDGGYVIAAEDRQTTIDRVYAAGNCADPMLNVPLATADGARAALAVNVRLVGDGIVQPRAAGAPR
ncbi:MAG TPA: NAD(P)/FAD-dependent oxidoreductase [Solirubrobacteraceae bacterium]|nr:NAD(P)/FAD-dependent oxidoreductase [Solirubrobacteraceae bacterium]